MGNFISKFDTTSEFTEFQGTTDYKTPHLSLTKDNGTLHYIQDPYNGHDYVEIGGLKWATMNVGASNITDYGLYFQWGDTKGWRSNQVGSGSNQKYFGWNDYKYRFPDSGNMIKYNSTDSRTTLEFSDDAVRQNWGGSWRMPTKDEFVALGNAVNAVWTNNYNSSGVKGLVCTSKTDSTKVLFFPASGYLGNGSFDNTGSSGYCWSSSLYSGSVNNGYLLYFYSGITGWQGNSIRYNGFPVRGVIG